MVVRSLVAGMCSLMALVIGSSTSMAADPVAGRWSGYWMSDTTGHSGPIRAVVRPAGTGYNVRFAGRFAGVIPFFYSSHFEAVPGEHGVQLEASKRLLLFGTFRTSARLTPTEFQAFYTSGRDRGRFVLTR